MAVFGAMLSYILQAVSFILLRRNQPGMERPFRSPLGIPAAAVTIALLTMLYQVQDSSFGKGVLWVIVWFAACFLYFALVGRHRLILSPEEEFALSRRGWAELRSLLPLPSPCRARFRPGRVLRSRGARKHGS